MGKRGKIKTARERVTAWLLRRLSRRRRDPWLDGRNGEHTPRYNCFQWMEGGNRKETFASGKEAISNNKKTCPDKDGDELKEEDNDRYLESQQAC